MKTRRKLRIGMFSWESVHAVKVGGVAPHVTELSEVLASKGHEVHIFTRNCGMESHSFINGVYYHRVDYNQPMEGIVAQMDRMCDSMFWMYLEMVDKFGPFDIIHGHDWHPVNILCKIKAEQGNPYLITYHSTEWGRNGNMHTHSWEAEIITHREWLGGYEAAETIITSEVLKNEVKYLYNIPEYKISLIPNGIFLDKIKRDVNPGHVKMQYGIHPEAPVILFIGRMSYQKGPDLLVRAISNVLPHRWDVQFVFIGEGEMRMHCENLAYELGVKHVAHFLGYASDDVSIDWYNAANIVCLPSRNEPFGIVVLEAWDAGKPVVATDAVKLIDNFKTGVTVYQYPESIAWGLNYTLDGLGTTDFGKEGRKLVETVYNWDTVADDTLKAYYKVLK